ncbi:MAG: hypothetical protein JST80_02700 [Bdellovibrionales bacterium]|nr:hypothetical protein [Bdellovibrionales bacterium]
MNLKLNTIHLLLACSCIILSTSLTLAREGNGSSGGGNSVIFPDGSVRLVDLVEQHDLPVAPATEAFIKKSFFSKSRYVRQLGKKDPTFFSCAIEKFKATDLASLKRLSEKLSKLEVYQIEIRLGQKKSQTSDAPVAYFSSASSKFLPEFQEPLAAFNKGQVWVAKRFYDRLPEDHKCGLAIHEALRFLNFTNIITEPLMTEEIEKTTASLIRGNPSLSNKLMNLKMRWTEVAKRAFQIKNDAVQVINDKACLIDSKLRESLWQSSTKFSDIARWTDGSIKDRDMMFEELQLYSQALFEGIESENSFSGNVKDKCYCDLRDNYRQMLNLLDDMILQSVLTMGEELNENMSRHLEYGMSEILFLDMAIEQKLPWYKRIDSWNAKVVAE